MWTRMTRWAVAALVGSAMTTIGCAREAPSPERVRVPVIADESLAHALDTRVDVRVRDRLELDGFLSERDIIIDVSDGRVSILGEVWTLQEKRRVDALVRSVGGALDVVNHLVVRPPR